MVLFNAAPDTQTFVDKALAGQAFELHPVLAAGSDAQVKLARYKAATGAFSVPGRTTAVFVVRGAPVTPTATPSHQVFLPAAGSGAAPAAPAQSSNTLVIGGIAVAVLVVLGAVGIIYFRRQ